MDERRNGTTTDLGIIKVTSHKRRDTIMLAHNNLKVAVINCSRPSRVTVVVNKDFHGYDENQWEEVFNAYMRWKRHQLPNFKFPRWSGHMKGGKRHPFRPPWKFRDRPGR